MISNSAKTFRVKHHPIWTWCGWLERLFTGDLCQIFVLCAECQQCEKIDISAKDIDSRPLAAYNPVSDFRQPDFRKERHYETHLSAKRIGSQASSWISVSDGHRRRSPCSAGTSCQGPRAPVSLVSRAAAGVWRNQYSIESRLLACT